MPHQGSGDPASRPRPMQEISARAGAELSSEPLKEEPYRAPTDAQAPCDGLVPESPFQQGELLPLTRRRTPGQTRLRNARLRTSTYGRRAVRPALRQYGRVSAQ